MLLILLLLMAILWVYLPKYSTTDLGLPKGFFANTTHGFCHNSCWVCSYWIGDFALSFSQYLVLKTFDKVLTDVGLIFLAYNLRRIFNLINQNLLRQYLKVLALHFGVLTPVYNAFYGLFYFKDEECFFLKRILIVF